ncbi:BglG family transcription antiterminator [Clostridium septicum]|uniref:PTS fructose transporter subunit IIA n=1 Tax=Clostridium septicum TaxID=1504 RepID=A0A9N7PJM9_CLOSE|nr:PTS sugar transporter subunit IIA [Clostridium septicum]AYE34976.1 PTS fructose transporter subunit IIA [Clostridium septicum]QAS60369.1 PRD domain-containing protein [Clostridium septicum]UEC20375.1 PTS sugar transporter subunit IIA [Clostridium septicum]USS01570.1 PTS sugar transporter subunit IIA [Clostridium septicum]
MSTLNKRQKEILILLEKKEEYMTLNEISKFFDVSSRTIRNDLDSIEYILKKYEVQLDRKPRLGVKLILKDGQYINEIITSSEINIYSSEDRILIIILVLLIKGKATIEELANEIGVSKNTLVQDLKEVINVLACYEIEVYKKSYYGITVNAEEIKVRNLFFSIYGRLNNDLKSDIKQRLLKETKLNSLWLENKIEDIERYIGTLYSQESIEELEIMILFLICRSNNNFKINDCEVNLKNRREFNILKDILDIENEEICYLLKLMDGLRRAIGGNVNNITEEILNELCTTLNIECDKDIEFTSQIAMHINAAINRVKNGLIAENPMLEEIKYKMSFIYKITEQILISKENILGVRFPEEEIAYMAMYFDAIFERSVKCKFTYRILVVCNGGLATSSLLKARISAMIPETEITSICRLSEVEKVLEEKNIDFIVSTIPVGVKGHKVIKVNPLLDSSDLEKIKTEIYNRRYEKNCKYLVDAVKGKSESRITNLFPREFTQFKVDESDWRKAVEIAAIPLLDNKKINSNYTKEIIKTIETIGNYMVFIPGIAFVHATPENVLKNSMSFLTLKSEISFGSKNKVSIKVIVVLANKNENMNLVNLIDILTKNNNIEKFKHAKDYNELKNIV